MRLTKLPVKGNPTSQTAQEEQVTTKTPPEQNIFHFIGSFLMLPQSLNWKIKLCLLKVTMDQDIHVRVQN